MVEMNETQNKTELFAQLEQSQPKSHRILAAGHGYPDAFPGMEQPRGSDRVRDQVDFFTRHHCVWYQRGAPWQNFRESVITALHQSEVRSCAG